jgi:hypothetical protein
LGRSSATRTVPEQHRRADGVHQPGRDGAMLYVPEPLQVQIDLGCRARRCWRWCPPTAMICSQSSKVARYPDRLDRRVDPLRPAGEGLHDRCHAAVPSVLLIVCGRAKGPGDLQTLDVEVDHDESRPASRAAPSAMQPRAPPAPRRRWPRCRSRREPCRSARRTRSRSAECRSASRSASSSAPVRNAM